MSQIRDEYRGHAFMIEVWCEDGVWKGRFHLLANNDEAAHARAAAAGLHRWVPMDDGWATENEAEMNATEAAHAAVNALFAGAMS